MEDPPGRFLLPWRHGSIGEHGWHGNSAKIVGVMRATGGLSATAVAAIQSSLVPTSLPCFLSLSKKRFYRFYQGIGEQDPECQRRCKSMKKRHLARLPANAPEGRAISYQSRERAARAVEFLTHVLPCATIPSSLEVAGAA